MVGGVPALFFLVPLEHREVGHPQELKILRIQQLVLVGIFLRGVKAQLAARHQHRLLGTLALGFARPSCEHQQIFLGCPTTLTDLRHGSGVVPLQPFDIVEDSQAALLAECFQLVALLAAQAAALRNVDRHQRQSVRSQILTREQIFDAMKWRNPQIRFVDAIGAHGLCVGQARDLCGHGIAGSLTRSDNQGFDRLVDLLLLRKRHLQVDLGELGLAIGSKVFVAEASHDLEILLETRHHQKLFEDLRRLWQRVKHSGADAAWHQVIARALWS